MELCQLFRTLSRTGVLYKLESSNGTLLGTITIPLNWAEKLRERGEVQFALSPTTGFGGDADEPMMLRTGLLAKSFGNHPDALMLFGITLEEFERLPGCSFMPGAGYLRSVIE